MLFKITKLITSLALMLVSLSFCVSAQKVNPACLNAPMETLDQKIDRVASCYGLIPRFFRAVIWAESSNKFQAVSEKGAACFTQLMPDTARRLGLRVDYQVDERFEVNKCLNGGASYLAWLLQTFNGDSRLALAGYNAGEGAVMKYGYRIPPFKQTVQYVEKILYVYTGQRGHGVGLAYNQPLAVQWADQLYAQRLGFNPQSADPRSTYSPSPETNDTTQNNENAEIKNQTEAVSETEKTAVKPSVTRVEIQRARVKTTSLVFWNKEK